MATLSQAAAIAASLAAGSPERWPDINHALTDAAHLQSEVTRQILASELPEPTIGFEGTWVKVASNWNRWGDLIQLATADIPESRPVMQEPKVIHIPEVGTPEYNLGIGLNMHNDAIQAWRILFIKYWEEVDPDKDFADYSEQQISEAWDAVIQPFVAGIDDGGMDYIVEYAPAFAEYVLATRTWFPLAGELEKEMISRGLTEQISSIETDITEQNRIQEGENRLQEELKESTAEENRIQAEENRIQEALDKLIRAMSWEV